MGLQGGSGQIPATWAVWQLRRHPLRRGVGDACLPSGSRFQSRRYAPVALACRETAKRVGLGGIGVEFLTARSDWGANILMRIVFTRIGPGLESWL